MFLFLPPLLIITLMSLWKQWLADYPVSVFNVGGVPEQIRHKENGYLAELKDSGSLAEGIRYVCESSVEEYQNMQKKAFDFVRDVASYERYK